MNKSLFASLLIISIISFQSCKSSKKQLAEVEGLPCVEVLKKHFVVNKNAFNIDKLVQLDDKLYIYGQVSGCNQGKVSVMWNDVSLTSEPPQVSVEFIPYQAGLCEGMVPRIWCFDLSRFKESGSKVIQLQIADTQSSILLEF